MFQRVHARAAAVDERWLRHQREQTLQRLDDLTREARIWVERWVRSHWDRLTARYGKRKVQQVLLAALLIVTVVCGPLSLIGTLHVISSFGQPADKPNLFDPHSHATSKVQPRPQPPLTQLTKHISLVNPPRPTTQQPPAGKAPSHISHAVSLPMKHGTLPVTAGTAATFTGSDGRFEIDVPADAVTADDAAHANGGSLALSISQIAPASGSNAGGSGRVSLGSYVIQVVDAHGTLAKQGLRKPIILKFHYGKGESALDLAHVLAVANQTLPDGIQLAPIASSSSATPAGNATPAPTTPGTRANSSFGKFDKKPMTLDTTNQVLSAPMPLSAPSTTMSFDTDSTVAGLPNADPFNADLNAGALTAQYPIDVPAGPGRLTPPIALAYDSEAVNSQHNPQAAAGWVGEG